MEGLTRGDSLDPLLFGGISSRFTTSSQFADSFGSHSQLRLSDFTGVPSYPDHFPTDSGDGRDLNYYLPLYKAALKGDWKAAKRFFKENPDAITEVISYHNQTALHVAAAAGHSKFVIKLVERTPPEKLALKDGYNGDTALHLASVAGITDAAKAMVEKNKDLTQIQNASELTPLLFCSAYVVKEQEDMIKYLSVVTRDEDPSPFSGLYGAQLICNITAAGLHDVALYLIQRYPQLATATDQINCTVLQVLAQKTSAFPSGDELKLWERVIYSCIPLHVSEERIRCPDGNPQGFGGDFSSRGPLIKFLSWTTFLRAPYIRQIYNKKLAHIQALELLKCICYKISLMKSDHILELFTSTKILTTAVKYGIVEIVIECRRILPDQILFVPRDGRSIFHIAVEHRREKVFNAMYGMGGQAKMLASYRVESNNNILHLVAKQAPSPQLNIVSGAALQMQRELQWYKEVEKIVQPTYRELVNNERETPRDVFTREHKELLEKGEKWMKDTAQSCMVVATLIATVMFAGIFTVPGGNISDSNNINNGVPIFLRKKTFMLFAISDALGLFLSTTSVLMFLSILTSRYSEEDFLSSLPKRLIIGLATLFFSIASMMIAFTAALTIVLGHRLAWASFPIVIIATLPVTSFALLQFPLLVEIFLSTYGAGIFRVDKKYKLD